MTEKLVSVVIPTWNRASLVCDAIDSILAQDWRALQIIVVDDGSTDDTSHVLARYGDAIEYFYQPNAGQASARNLALEQARGEFISFLDSDDIWLPHKLRQEMEVFDRLPEAGTVFSDSEHWLNGKLVLPSRFQKTGLRSSGDPYYLPIHPPLWVERSLVSTCCMILRREILSVVGTPLFDQSRAVNEDWELEMRLMHYSRIAVYPAITAIVRRFPDETRKERAMPGVPRTPEQSHKQLSKHCSLLERGLLLPGLRPDIKSAVSAKLEQVQDEREALAASMAAGACG